jgi:2-polyprenyl-6-methoxyphenol hydroxylase-like FAD-dependent oxidoreductase
MNIEIIGAGPTGLYTAILLKSAMTLSLLGKRVTLDGIGFSVIGRLRELSPRFMAKYDRHLSTTGIEEKTI